MIEQTNKFTVLAKLTALPGYEKVLREAAGIIWTESRKEEGCEMFLFNILKGEPGIIYFFEVFRSKEDFEYHLSLEHTKRFLSFLKGKIEGDFPVQTFLSRIED